MAQPTLTFLYNHSWDNNAYSGQAWWRTIRTASPEDVIVFTGGGIEGTVSGTLSAYNTIQAPTATRDATIRPTSASYVIPQTFVDSTNNSLMYEVPTKSSAVDAYASKRYVFGVNVSGTMNSDLYLEAWDDNSFSTTNLDVLQGSANNGNESCINAIRTTGSAPPASWDGDSAGAAFLRGTSDRVPLKNASSITDETVYFNIYVRLETDTPTFADTPILGFRYLFT